MVQKYRNGQKIKIIEVKNEYGHLKYPEIQKHVNEIGTILDSYFIPMQGLEGTTLEGEVYDMSLYKIHLDKDGTILDAVTEDALEALDE